MKFLEILISFLVTQGKSFMQSNTEALTHQIVNNARRVTLLLATIVISITLFCIGFSMAYAAVVSGFDQSLWTWSPHLTGGLVLVMASVIGLACSFSERRWLDATGLNPREKEAAKESSTTPMETAIAMILVEVANELRERRKSTPSAATAD